MADSKPRTPKPRQVTVKLLEGALVKLQPPEQGQETGAAVASTELAVPPKAGAGVQGPGSSPLARLKSKRKPKLRSKESAVAEILSRRTIVENFRSRLLQESEQGQATPSATDSTEPAQPFRTATASTEPVAVPATSLALAAVPAAAQPAAAQPFEVEPAEGHGTDSGYEESHSDTVTYPTSTITLTLPLVVPFPEP